MFNRNVPTIEKSRRPLATRDLNVELTSNVSSQHAANSTPKPDVAPLRLDAQLPKSSDCCTVSRRNERERNRVKLLNLGFDRLRAVVPSRGGEQLSKISTLKKAIWYIEHLDKVLHGQTNDEPPRKSGIVHQNYLLARPVTYATDRDTFDKTSTSGPLNRAGELAVGMAPWSSAPTSSELGIVRPVTKRLPSPIFPKQLGQLSSVECITPPHMSTTMHTSNQTATDESGYGSLLSSNSSQMCLPFKEQPLLRNPYANLFHFPPFTQESTPPLAKRNRTS